MPTNSPVLVVPPPAPAGTNATNAAIEAMKDINDIRPPVYVFDQWWLLFTLIAIGLILLGLLIWFLLRRKNRLPPLPVMVPAHERARQKLQAALDLLDKPKPFCILVSDAVRLYLEERFELQAPDRTTEEFLDELRWRPVLSSAQKDLLRDFLSRCDLVKFAKVELAPNDLQGLYTAALRLIDETSVETAPAAPAPPSTPPPLPAGVR